MFRRHEKIPDEREFPNVKSYLDSYEFPGHILTEERLRDALRPARIESIRRALSRLGDADDDIRISYMVPWYDKRILKKGSVDMIYSQATLEHVEDREHVYEVCSYWLKPGGVMSHQIDFKSHEVAKEWNGHWAYSDLLWRLIKGKRQLISREPYSTHSRLLRAHGFEIVCSVRIRDDSGIGRERLAPRFRNMPDDDLTTSNAFAQARKTGPMRQGETA